MLIRNDESLFRTGLMDEAKKRDAAAQHWVAEQLGQGRVLDDMDMSPTNMDRQMGRMMTGPQLEVIMKKLNQNLHFEVHPNDSALSVVYQLMPDGSRKYISAYQRLWMPEYSLFKVNYEEHPDPDIPRRNIGGISAEVIERGSKPMRRVAVPWGEAVRGWRTVLVYLVRNRLTTPDAVERVAGASDRASWAAHTGKDAVSWC